MNSNAIISPLWTSNLVVWQDIHLAKVHRREHKRRRGLALEGENISLTWMCYSYPHSSETVSMMLLAEMILCIRMCVRTPTFLYSYCVCLGERKKTTKAEF